MNGTAVTNVTAFPSERDATVTAAEKSVTDAFRSAYEEASRFIADKHDVRQAELQASPELRALVFAEAVTSLAYSPGLSEVTASAYLPRECSRSTCTNTVPRSRKWCSAACRQWGARQRRERPA